MFHVSPIQPVTKGDQVLSQLRSLIIERKVATGSHLVEDELAAQFAVSRGPVRDALRQLELEGLVERQRRGVIVKELTRRDVDELYSLRESLETLALRTAMTRVNSATEWDVAERLVEQMRQAAERDRADELGVIDMEFHGQFYHLSQHTRLLSVWENYRPMFLVMLGRRNRLPSTAESHAELLAAARSGDPDLAVECLKSHLHESRGRLLDALDAQEHQ